MALPYIVMESIVHFYDYIRLQWRVSLTFMTVTYIVMECITHLYHCILDYNGEYRSPF
jgi:hypothetical protein